MLGSPNSGYAVRDSILDTRFVTVDGKTAAAALPEGDVLRASLFAVFRLGMKDVPEARFTDWSRVTTINVWLIGETCNSGQTRTSSRSSAAKSSFTQKFD
jgi:hypothetical protein